MEKGTAREIFNRSCPSLYHRPDGVPSRWSVKKWISCTVSLARCLIRSTCRITAISATAASMRRETTARASYPGVIPASVRTHEVSCYRYQDRPEEGWLVRRTSWRVRERSTSEKTEQQDYILQVSHLKKYFPIKGGMFGNADRCCKSSRRCFLQHKTRHHHGTGRRVRLWKIHDRKDICSGLIAKTDGTRYSSMEKIYTACDHKELRDLRTKMQIIFQDPYSSIVSPSSGRRDHWRGSQ